MRLSALRPLHGARWDGKHQLLHRESNLEIFCSALPVLERAQLVHSYARGESFRWHIAIPSQLLAIAITECYLRAGGPGSHYDAFPGHAIVSQS